MMSDGTYNGWKIGDGFVAVGPHDQVKGRNAQPGGIRTSNPPTSRVTSQSSRPRARRLFASPTVLAINLPG